MAFLIILNLRLAVTLIECMLELKENEQSIVIPKSSNWIIFLDVLNTDIVRGRSEGSL